MNNSNDIKEKVKSGYADLSKPNEKLNCGIGKECAILVDMKLYSEDYEGKEGYNENANLGLGCGIPTNYVNIKEGHIVLDLGCGAGNDCFIAHKYVKASGKVIGLDMTTEMLQKAWENLDNCKEPINNIEFRLGDIENIPIYKPIVDVIISNCVINLVPKKEKAFKEMHRVLKPGGQFSISDLVTSGRLPAWIAESASLYVAGVSGGLPIDDYLNLIKRCGFVNVEIKSKKVIEIPENIIKQSYNKDNWEADYQEYLNSNLKLYSITIVAEKNGLINLN